MTRNDFWVIIDESVRQYGHDQSAQIELIQNRLGVFREEDIVDFERILRKLLIDCDYYNILAIPKITEGFVTDDSYLYFRCWLIGRGRQAYETAIKSPDSVSDFIINRNETLDFEKLLYAATVVYELKTGLKENELFPRGICEYEGLSYDFYTGSPKGQDWTEDELPQLLPRIWALYNHRMS